MEDTYLGKDEATLRNLLDNCHVFEERRKIRAAIRVLRDKSAKTETYNGCNGTSKTYDVKYQNGHRHNNHRQPASSVHGKTWSIINSFPSNAERRATFQQRRELGLTFNKEAGKNAAQHHMLDTNPYENISDEDELNRLLKEAPNLDDRILIRRVLRKLRDKDKTEAVPVKKFEPVRCELRVLSSTSSSSSSPASSGRSSPTSRASPPDYSSIHDLKQLESLLDECSVYEERKKIRAAITSLKKRKAQEHEKPVDKNFSPVFLRNKNNMATTDVIFSQTHKSTAVMTLNNNNKNTNSTSPVTEIKIENRSQQNSPVNEEIHVANDQNNSNQDCPVEITNKLEEIHVENKQISDRNSPVEISNKLDDDFQVGNKQSCNNGESPVELSKENALKMDSNKGGCVTDDDVIVDKCESDTVTSLMVERNLTNIEQMTTVAAEIVDVCAIGGSDADSEGSDGSEEKSQSSSSSSSSDESDSGDSSSSEDTVESLEEKLKIMENMLDECRDFEQRRELRAAMRECRSRIRDLKSDPEYTAEKVTSERDVEAPKSQKETTNTSSATLTLSGSQTNKNNTALDSGKNCVVMRNKNNICVEEDVSLQNGHRHVTMKVIKSRTPSQSEVTEQNKVIETTLETSDGAKVHERDNVVIKHKVTNRGSEYYETEKTHSKEVTDDGKEGSDFRQVEIVKEKDAHSVSSGEYTYEITETNVIEETPHLDRLETVPEKEPLQHTNSSGLRGKQMPLRRANLVSKTSSGYGSQSSCSDEEASEEDTEKFFSGEDEKKEENGIQNKKNLETDGTTTTNDYEFEALDGEQAELHCFLSCPPDGNIAWYKGDRLLTPSKEFTQTYSDGVAKLVITEVFPDDEGEYRCEVTTIDGKTEAFVKLKVKDNENLVMPNFEKALTNQTVIEGESVTFLCHVTGKRDPSIRWFHDKKLIPNSADFKQTYNGLEAQLQVSEAFLDDGGKYSCLATNNGGEAEAICLLTVKEVLCLPPEFQQPLYDLTVKEGDPLNLEVKVMGTPVPRVTWYQDNNLVLGSAECEISYDGKTANLTISKTSQSNSGCYKCVAENSAGEIASLAIITVKKPPPPGSLPKFLCGLDDVTLHEGDRLSLLVKVKGSPDTEISWYQDNKLLRDAYGYKQKYSGGIAKLTVAEVENDDAGCYKCVAKNFAGEESVSALVTVKKAVTPSKYRFTPVDKVEKAPRFSKHLFSATGRVGGSVMLECPVSGVPLPSIWWYKKGKELPSSGKYIQKYDGTTVRMELKDLTLDDSGRYECVARNTRGEDRASYKVTINEEKNWPLGGSSVGMTKDSARSLIAAALTKSKELDTANMADVSQMTDEDQLHELLRKTEDFEERKKIRARMRELADAKEAEMERRRREREQAREEGIKQKHAKAAEAKAKQIQQMTEEAREKMLSTKIGVGEQARRDRLVKAEEEKQHRLQELSNLNEIKKDIYLTGVGKKDMEEQAVFRSTKTETGADGGKTTTHTTTTTQRSKDGTTTVTKQTKQMTKTGGFGGTNVTINKTVAAKTTGATGGASRPNMMRVLPLSNIRRNANTIKQEILNFCKANTQEYEGVEISNFSSSWNNGMAFCALIHHFYPKAFDFSKLNPKNRRFNFSLAFDCAEKMGGIAPLLEVDDMVRMKNPDWKCVFTYVQSFYRRFREAEANAQNKPE